MSKKELDMVSVYKDITGQDEEREVKINKIKSAGWELPRGYSLRGTPENLPRESPIVQ